MKTRNNMQLPCQIPSREINQRVTLPHNSKFLIVLWMGKSLFLNQFERIFLQSITWWLIKSIMCIFSTWSIWWVMWFVQIVLVDGFTNIIQWVEIYFSKNVGRKLCPFESRAIPCKKAKGALCFLYYFVLLIFYKAFSWGKKRKRKKKRLENKNGTWLGPTQIENWTSN